MSIHDAIRKLHQANDAVKSAIGHIEPLAEESEYNEMASLVAKAASALLAATVNLLEEHDDAAFDLLEQADDYLDAAMDVVDEENLDLSDEEVEELRDDDL